jgi:hypothetical protein
MPSRFQKVAAVDGRQDRSTGSLFCEVESTKGSLASPIAARRQLKKKGLLMKNVTRLIAVAGVGVSLVALAKADEVMQFTALPQVVQSSVIKETRIASPTKVVRVVQDTGGSYAVTYLSGSGQQIVYVSPTGAILQTPASTVRETTTTTTTEQPNTVVTQRPATVVESTGPEAVVTTEEVQQVPSRYEPIEKKGNKEVYLDHQTGQKVKVERK